MATITSKGIVDDTLVPHTGSMPWKGPAHA